MKWYSGQIPDAIAKAKQLRSIFIVYISGDDEQSKQMEDTWTDDAISTLCESENMVALRIPADSDTCKQFSAIYPVFITPCTFFIGENGTPLEVTGGHVPPEKFTENIQKALKLQKDEGQASPTPSAPPASAAAASAPSSSAASSSPGAESVMPSAPVAPLDDRVQKAKDLVAQKQREKAEKEREEEKKKEADRRKMGQDMNRLKAMQAEAEAKELRDQLKKDKEEEKMARQRIKDQIARDREERQAKYHKEKQEKAAVVQQKKEAKAELTSQEEAARMTARLEHARLQFRLPDGSALTQQFSSSDTLSTARDYLLQQIGNSLGSVVLSVTYPKRVFTEQDMSQTLRSLDLAPSAAIIVLPASSRMARPTAGSSAASNDTGLFAMIFAPFLALWNFLVTFLFGAPTRQVAPPPSAPAAAASADEPTPGGSGARPKSSYGVRNRQANAKRLHNLSDDDEDKATWNGNSTQQL